MGGKSSRSLLVTVKCFFMVERKTAQKKIKGGSKKNWSGGIYRNPGCALPLRVSMRPLTRKSNYDFELPVSRTNYVRPGQGRECSDSKLQYASGRHCQISHCGTPHTPVALLLEAEPCGLTPMNLVQITISACQYKLLAHNGPLPCPILIHCINTSRPKAADIAAHRHHNHHHHH